MTDTTETVVETTAPDANVTEQVATPESSPGAVDTSDKSAKPNGAQKRIDELTWHRRNLERDVNYWRDLALKNQQQPAVETKPQVATAPKKLADFNYDEDAYQAYLEDVVADKAAAKAEARLREKQERESKESIRKDSMTKFREREAKIRAELEDYEDFAYTAPIDNVTDIVMAMDEGPRIAYYLGKNPETAARINSLPAHLAAVELGRLDARLATEREQAKAKPVSKAPPPPPKIDATEPAVDKDPSQMSDVEFAKWRKRQIAQRR
jgi:hypothetical protein